MATVEKEKVILPRQSKLLWLNLYFWRGWGMGGLPIDIDMKQKLIMD
jgi:hypothetical protein